MTDDLKQSDRERLEKLPEHEIDDPDTDSPMEAPPAASGILAQGGTVVGDPTPRPDPMDDEPDDEGSDDARTIPADPTRTSPEDQVRR